MHTISKNGAEIYIRLKSGEGTVLVDEDKLGKPMQREFTLWTQEDFHLAVNKTVSCTYVGSLPKKALNLWENQQSGCFFTLL